MAAPNRYTPEHRKFIADGWNAGKSASMIAADFTARFGMAISRSGVIGVADRLGLPRRATTGPWRLYPEREPKLAKPKPKPAPKPQEGLSEPIPVGLPGEYLDTGCRWLHGDKVSEFQFCGHPKWSGTPYCENHAAKAYDKTRKPMVGTSRADRTFR